MTRSAPSQEPGKAAGKVGRSSWPHAQATCSDSDGRPIRRPATTRWAPKSLHTRCNLRTVPAGPVR